MAASFDALLQADRQKRKNEELANQLLGKGRRSSTPSNGIRKPGAGGSLASRIGTTKRSFSTIPRTYSAPQDPAVITSQPVHPLASARQPRPIRDNSMLRKAQRERLSEKLIKMDLVPKAEDQAKMQEDVEHSILGAAGPYTVVGSNFAPGTTAADIESAMAPHGGEMLGCQITSHRPTVVAEMVYAEKARGENIIATFNNKRADGRLLHVFLKTGKPSTFPKPSTQEVPHSEIPRNDPPRNDAPLNDPPYGEESQNQPPRNAPSEPKAARVDLTYEEDSYSKQREQSDRNRRRAEPEIQDGSFGFEKKEDHMEIDNDDRRDDRRNFHYNRERHYGRGRDMDRPREQRRLYSDDLYPRPRGRGFR